MADSPPFLSPPSRYSSSPTCEAGCGPAPADFIGKWAVISSSSSFWADKRNVSVLFTLQRPPSTSDLNSPFYTEPINSRANSAMVFNNETSYQPLSSRSCQTTVGTDRPAKPTDGSTAMDWRGTGWLKIARVRWEILGYAVKCLPGDEKIHWMVVYAEKSLFTPASLSIYCKAERLLSDDLIQSIQSTLADMAQKSHGEELGNLVGSMASVRQEHLLG